VILAGLHFCSSQSSIVADLRYLGEAAQRPN